MEDIDTGPIALAEEIKSHNIHSIAIPALGCGLGGLNWHDVRPRIEKMLEQLSDLRAIVFVPTELHYL